MSCPRFTVRKSDCRLVGADDRDWSSYVEFFSPAIPDSMEVLSLGGRYVVSLGAHGMHANLLMDRHGAYPLSVAEAQTACAVIAFASDSPVVLQYGMTKRPLADERTFGASFRDGPMLSAEAYGEALAETAELAYRLDVVTSLPGERVSRCFGRRGLRSNEWWHYPWPESDAVARALSAYSLGLLSILAPSQVLNYWRAIEAIFRSAKARAAFFACLETFSVVPVWAWSGKFQAERGQRHRINIAARLRTFALRRWRQLMADHVSAESAGLYLYEKRRGKAAHADRESLEFDHSADVAQQYSDAMLLRYAARVAIESAWPCK